VLERRPVLKFLLIEFLGFYIMDRFQKGCAFFTNATMEPGIVDTECAFDRTTCFLEVKGITCWIASPKTEGTFRLEKGAATTFSPNLT